MIHIYTLNSLNICLDVNSGTIHLLDEVTKDILLKAPEKEMIENAASMLSDKYSNLELKEALSEIKSLIDEKSLYSPDFDRAMFTGKTIKKVVVKAMCLHMAHDCNLRCKYCFAEKGSYGGKKSLMSFDVAKQAIDFLLANSGSKKNVEVDFFGGEPLLNYDVIKQTVEYAKEKQKEYGKTVHFTVTTNGTILNEEMEKFLNENMDNIVLSLDGRKEINDAVRVYPSGKGSYDQIIDNIKTIANNRNGKSYFVRGTYTRDNLDFSKDVRHIYEELGLKEISIEPVTGGAFTLTDEEINVALKEYEQFACEYALQDDYRFYHFNISLYHSPCIYKRIAACGAGVDYFAVSPDGDLFACHQFVGEKQFKMGDVFNGITDYQRVNQFHNSNVFTKKGCQDCFAKYFCSGGCHANAYYTNNDILIPDENACKMQKKRIECALMIETLRALKRSENEEQ
ncbi:MAG: thioether cross-link-forming SCIFF peptide maturase [Clostridia bacterium]|nr:thioether cross-link-forming SCIFF peptide maturase [Clostridia bacterium]